jgi:hypothetical protein
MKKITSLIITFLLIPLLSFSQSMMGDNLGNHKATKNLNLNNFDINKVNSIQLGDTNILEVVNGVLTLNGNEIAGGGGSFDQDLNTTDDVEFKSITSTGRVEGAEIGIDTNTLSVVDGELKLNGEGIGGGGVVVEEKGVYVIPFSSNITINPTNGSVQYLEVTNNVTIGISPSILTNDNLITFRVDYKSGTINFSTDIVDYSSVSLPLQINRINTILYDSPYSRTNWSAYLLGTLP